MTLAVNHPMVPSIAVFDPVTDYEKISRIGEGLLDCVLPLPLPPAGAGERVGPCWCSTVCLFTVDPPDQPITSLSPHRNIWCGVQGPAPAQRRGETCVHVVTDGHTHTTRRTWLAPLTGILWCCRLWP